MSSFLIEYKIKVKKREVIIYGYTKQHSNS